MTARPLIEAVCSCGFRQDCSVDSIALHLVSMSQAGEDPRAHYWHIEHDGINFDDLSGAERRRRTQAGEREKETR